MRSRGLTLLVSIALLVGLSITGAVMRVPYVALGPGPVTDTLGSENSKPLIRVTGLQTYPSSGKLELTTVAVDFPLTLWQAVQAWWDDSRAVVPKEVIYPPKKTTQQVEAQNKQEMSDSRTDAVIAALTFMHLLKVTIVTVPKTGASFGKLKPGDVLTAVDGKAIGNEIDLRNAIGQHLPGDLVSVTYLRGKDPAKTITIRTKASPDQASRPAIGVTLRNANASRFDVSIVGLDQVGGPSAGLMFALGIVDRLTPDDLTGGQVVAGTGTIDPQGKVGAIGGIPLKMIAARASGAHVFLTPADNCAEAKAATPKGLRLIKVTNLSDAVQDLRALAAGRSDLPAC